MSASQYYAATMPRDAVRHAREWLYNHTNPSMHGGLRLANAVGIIGAMESRYAGGYVAFLRDIGMLRDDWTN